MSKIVGFTGYARSGKNTAAQALVEEGWAPLAFADALREVLVKLNPILCAEEGPDLAFALKYYNGWEGVKNSAYKSDVRDWLSKVGQAMRDVHEDVWVDALRPRVERHLRNGVHVVITDVRYANEAALVRSLGGAVFRIHRPGFELPMDLPGELSQRAIVPNDTIANSGTPGSLQAKVLRSIKRFGLEAC